ncbi:hypothetical protein, partial [Sinorhizobium meliloti]|uniref:hypothetical protein n=1 Tax=Rhizobium meliloti TaxID=382 RepID=UPI003999D8CF
MFIASPCRAEGKNWPSLDAVVPKPQNRDIGSFACAATTRDCQEFCAVGHDDEKERIITWLSRKNFWTSSWL